MGKTRFFRERLLHEKKNIAKALAHGLSLGSYHILMKKNLDPSWSYLSQATTSHKRASMLDILGGCLREVRL